MSMSVTECLSNLCAFSIGQRPSKDRKTSEKCFSRNVLVLLGMLIAYVDWLLSTISSYDQRHSECITSTFHAISPEFDSMYNFRKTFVYAFRSYYRKSILKGNEINKK